MILQNCGCQVYLGKTRGKNIVFCPIHAAAAAMNDALNEIARDATELAAMEGIDKGERRAWQAIANKAKKALGEK